MAIEKWNDPAQGAEKVGFEMVKVGAGGGVAMLAAGILPFITLPMVLVFLVIGGLLLSLKG